MVGEDDVDRRQDGGQIASKRIKVPPPLMCHAHLLCTCACVRHADMRLLSYKQPQPQP